MDISVVIPLLNEDESLRELCEWIGRVMKENNFSYEIIMIDDGSTDDSWEIIEKLSAETPEIKGIKFRRNYGKSAALFCGFEAAEGEVVITMDGDIQDNPDEIPEFYRMITEEKYDLVSGWKKKRHDPILSKNMPSKFFNWAARRMSGIKLHDFNCGFKAYHKQVVKSIEVYGEMHRYIPVLAKQAGYKKIAEKPVVHLKRKYGTTKFGMERFVNGFLDLLTITFISKFGKRPMHFFGTMGTLMFVLGFLASAWLGAKKLYITFSIQAKAMLVTSSPYFYIALTLMLMGVQLFLTGFIGELVSRSSSERNTYQIEKKVSL